MSGLNDKYNGNNCSTKRSYLQCKNLTSFSFSFEIIFTQLFFVVTSLILFSFLLLRLWYIFTCCLRRDEAVKNECALRKLRINFRTTPYLIMHVVSMYVVLCINARKRSRGRILPKLLYYFFHYFPLTRTCMQNEVCCCTELQPRLLNIYY